MMEKVVAVMAAVTMLAAGPVMNHATAEAYTLEIEKGTVQVGTYYKTKQNNAATAQISINSGVIPGSLHVSARLVRKNANGGIINSMSGITFTSNGTQTGNYASGDGIRGKSYYLAARVIDSSRFDNANINYNFEP